MISSDPEFIRFIDLEVTIHQIHGTITGICAACKRFLLPSVDPSESFDCYEALDGAAGKMAEVSFPVGCCPHFPGPITGVVGGEDTSELFGDLLIPDRPS